MQNGNNNNGKQKADINLKNSELESKLNRKIQSSATQRNSERSKSVNQGGKKYRVVSPGHGANNTTNNNIPISNTTIINVASNGNSNNNTAASINVNQFLIQ